MRIAIAGTGRLGASLILPLLAEHEIVAVLQDARRVHRLRRRLLPLSAAMVNTSTSLIGIARHRRIPILWIDKMSDRELTPLRALEPDLILVGGFGIIFKPPLLELPRIGCINTHSSLLPRHRGPNPFAAAILSGDEETGVTFHVMTPGIDNGDILHQVPFPIDRTDTSVSLYKRACLMVKREVHGVVARVGDQGLAGTPQDESLATYDKRITEADTWVDWSRPAEEIDRLVRAFAVPPMARFRHKRSVVRLLRASYSGEDRGGEPGEVLSTHPRVVVACGRGALTVLAAVTPGPLPWLWPNAATRLRVGDVLE